MQIVHITPDTSYIDVLAMQEQAVINVLNGGEETLFFVEHAAIFTLGSSAHVADVLAAGDIPTLQTGRGGQVTYHGPGQRVVYPILDLSKRQKDLRWYVKALQHWIVATLAEFDIQGEITDDVGVWVEDAKIAAIGIRVRKWVTFHGFAMNVHPDLSAFERIVPCGIQDKGVTSLQKLGIDATLAEVDDVVLNTFKKSDLYL